MKLFKNKYRTKTVRLQSWDYTDEAAYFITICTNGYRHYFGEVRNEEMYLSALGEVVMHEWVKTKQLRPDMNLELDEFVIMPNHFHAIIIIGENKYNKCRDTMPCVSHQNSKKRETSSINKFGPQRKNLASIIRGFKSSVTIYARKNGMQEFAWQPKFHEHIIRNADVFHKIQNYIVNNPESWHKDKFYRPTM